MIAIPLKETDPKSLLEQMAFFARKGNLNRGNFADLDKLLSAIGKARGNGKLTDADLHRMRNSFDGDFLKGTLLGRGLLKPCGAALDYMLLDKIYTHYTSNNLNFRVWDEHFQQQTAVRAVRNGKVYFQDCVRARTNKNRDMDLLKVVSGSGRELSELYGSVPSKENLRTSCIETDDRAITYAKWLNVGHLDSIKFVQSSIFSYRAMGSYDLIWSAGAFNYLNDRSVVLLLQRFGEWLREGGEIVAGNCNHDHNPSRDYMELLGDCFLIHRTEEELFDLGRQAGFGPAQIKIGREEENVLLFLHLRKE